MFTKYHHLKSLINGAFICPLFLSTKILQKLNQLKPETLIYCAHEYTESNLKFTLSEIPDEFIENYFKKISTERSKGEISIPTTLELERKINPFLLDVIPSDLQDLPKLEQFTELRTRKDNA